MTRVDEVKNRRVSRRQLIAVGDAACRGNKGTDEVISAEEIAESEAALQDYRTGQDSGVTSTALKQHLFGHNVG